MEMYFIIIGTRISENLSSFEIITINEKFKLLI